MRENMRYALCMEIRAWTIREEKPEPNDHHRGSATYGGIETANSQRTTQDVFNS